MVTIKHAVEIEVNDEPSLATYLSRTISDALDMPYQGSIGGRVLNMIKEAGFVLHYCGDSSFSNKPPSIHASKKDIRNWLFDNWHESWWKCALTICNRTTCGDVTSLNAPCLMCAQWDSIVGSYRRYELDPTPNERAKECVTPGSCSSDPYVDTETESNPNAPPVVPTENPDFDGNSGSGL